MKNKGLQRKKKGGTKEIFQRGQKTKRERNEKTKE